MPAAQALQGQVQAQPQQQVQYSEQQLGLLLLAVHSTAQSRVPAQHLLHGPRNHRRYRRYRLPPQPRHVLLPLPLPPPGHL